MTDGLDVACVHAGRFFLLSDAILACSASLNVMIIYNFLEDYLSYD